MQGKRVLALACISLKAKARLPPYFSCFFSPFFNTGIYQRGISRSYCCCIAGRKAGPRRLR